MNKRLTIYMTYNKNGIIDDYIVYMLKQLVNVSSDIIVVSNKKLKQREKEKIAFVSLSLIHILHCIRFILGKQYTKAFLRKCIDHIKI